MRFRLFVLFAFGVALLPPAALAAQDGGLYAALRDGGHVALMRHATAPGFDDPPGFRLGDCATQRNLSAGGRSLAEAIGARLRTAGITRARIVSSQWCRCLDTARLLGFGRAEELPSLNSLVSYPAESAKMTADARAWILKQDLRVPTILVTHQVNISALVGGGAGEGDLVIVERTPAGELRAVGTIAAN